MLQLLFTPKLQMCINYLTFNFEENKNNWNSTLVKKGKFNIFF